MVSLSVPIFVFACRSVDFCVSICGVAVAGRTRNNNPGAGRRRWLGCALALTLVLWTGCGHSDSSRSGAGTTGASTTVAHAPAKFEPGPCPATPQPVPELQGARCGTLTVPEDRTKPDARTLRLAVATIPSQTQPTTADPIVFLTGGPGGDVIANPPMPKDVTLNHNRDLILLSQRGTHSSQPALTCPEIDKFFATRVGVAFDAESTGDQYVRAVKACRDRLAGGANLAAFNSTESAYDLADLRAALGIKQWDVYSHSYGTDLALIYMRQDPQGIHSVILDGVAPPSVASPGWTWSNVREAFDNMTSVCTAQQACQARYPDVVDTFVRQVNQLEAHPVTTTVNVAGVGDTKVVLDGGALLNWFTTLATHFPAEFPADVDALLRGNPQPIAERYASIWVDPSKFGIMGWGLTLSVWCAEWVPFESADDQLRAAQQVFASLPDTVRAQAPQLPFLRQACAAWNVPKAADSVRAVTDSAIPTLVLSGSYDGQTAPQWGSYVASHLSHATVVTVPGSGHGVYDDPCGAKVIASYFDNPQQPDTGCVGATQPPTYTVNPPPP
jgi:pimeloyl-ACP methyl ester carboxylesterase